MRPEGRKPVRALLTGLALAALGATPASACLPSDWVRHDGPVFRDKLFFGLYEAASDPHVFATDDGRLAMIYSGDDEDHSSIKLAFGTDWDSWEEWGVLLGPSQQPGAIAEKETAFYHRASATDHRIYFIGYEDGATYRSDIYLARAEALTGPWTILPEPVLRRGETDGHDVYLITSPSVVEWEGGLVMAYLGWNGLQNVTAVWSFAATSSPDGVAWEGVRQADVPIGMEGQITARPDGGFVAVATREAAEGREGIFAACADTPLGPWTEMPEALLTLAGDAWEVDEIIAPSTTYDPETGDPYLFYTSAEHSKGWRVMLARPAE
ncbi:hypothetical protein FHY55_16635 [Oceanicola sp. D3]|uniref:hypothetical protein n=1 Tax=Oceanicola sp. D3 TaxID=2587163 RepID=UPI00111F586D|nr:hypothetical protein [Oceanicola sp. D3]QDC10756.1 hypothetical protein FHY55_16635 [Oceanicola sp. D3]